MPSCPRPIVLLHGFLGFDRLWGLEYFKGVPALFKRRHPGATVLTPRLDPDATIAARAEELEALLNKELGRREPVHLIAHSMGGLDARRFIGFGGGAGRVRSLTTLGTPHWGTPAAERLARIFSGKKTKAYRDFVERLRAGFRGAGAAASWLFDILSPFHGGLRQMTPEAMARFNATCPNAPGVAYFSVAAAVRRREEMSPILIPFERWIRDTPDPLTGGLNDGLVSVGSARGEGLGANGFVYLGRRWGDHFHMIGHDWSPVSRMKKWFKRRLPPPFHRVYLDVLRRIERL
jgi:triacylglycerol lipase